MKKSLDKSNVELIEIELSKTFDDCNEPLKEMLSLLERVQNTSTKISGKSHPDIAKRLNDLMKTVKQLDVLINQK